jgi:16S rRNA (guanine1207-N2)-methyltransferase
MGYYDILRQRATLGGEKLTLLVKPGLVAWGEVEMATGLLAESAAESVEFGAGARVLVLEGGTGALAAWAARRGARVDVCDDSLVAGRLMRAMLDLHGIAGVTVHDAPFPPPAWAGRSISPCCHSQGPGLYQACSARRRRPSSRAGGCTWPGRTAPGPRAIIQDAAAILAARRPSRPRAATGSGWPCGWPTARRAVAGTVLRVRGAGAAPVRRAGSFQPRVAGRGHPRLVETLDGRLCAGCRVLDVGCGSGAIGRHAARLGAAAVDLIDASRLAGACAGRGIQENRLGDTCRAWASDLYSDVPGPAYDLILSNPPVHAGHAVDTDAATELIAGAKARLATGGRLRIVANAFLSYDRLLREVFGAARVVAEDARYRVLEGKC